MERVRVHGDTRQAEIFLTVDGRAQILDCGLARWKPKRAVADVDGTSATQAATAMDLVSCTSAEQGLGEKLDGRSDIFWLGVVPYQMATRDLPFSGEAHKAVFSSTLHQLPVPPREHNPKVREELECFITGALAKCRGLGYWSAAVTRDDLSRLVEEKERAFSSPVVVAVEAATVTVAEEPAEPADLAVEREEEGKAASRLFSGLTCAAAGDQKMAVYAAGSESLRVTYPYAVTCRHDLKSLPSELATCVAPSR